MYSKYIGWKDTFSLNHRDTPKYPLSRPLSGNPGPTQPGLAVSCCHHGRRTRDGWNGMEDLWQASHKCLILGLDFPISRVPQTYSTELQISVLFPESAPIPSSDALYWFQCGIRQFPNTEAPRLPPSSCLSLEERFEMGRRLLKKRWGFISILAHLPPRKLL